MTKNQLLKKCTAYCATMAPYMGFNEEWKFECVVSDRLDSSTEIMDAEGSKEDNGDMAANVTLWHYRRAKMWFSYMQLKDASDRLVMECVVHEMAHAQIAEMREWNANIDNVDGSSRFYGERMKHEEAVVSAISTGLMKVVDQLFLRKGKIVLV